jgi:hypothetical protein
MDRKGRNGKEKARRAESSLRRALGHRRFAVVVACGERKVQPRAVVEREERESNES